MDDTAEQVIPSTESEAEIHTSSEVVTESLAAAAQNISDDSRKQVLIEEKKALTAMRRTRGKFEDVLADLKQKSDEIQTEISSLEEQSNSIVSCLEQAKESAGNASIASIEAESSMAKAASVVLKASDLEQRLDGLQEEAASIEQKAEKAATRCEHINDGFEYVTEMRPKVEQSAEYIKSSASKIKDLTEQAIEQKAQISALKTQLDGVVDEAEVDGASVSEFAKSLKVAEDKVKVYEDALDENLVAYTDLKSKIESLLPDATSAGLASAFYMRARQFKKPAAKWDNVFLLTVFGLFGVGVWWVLSISEVAELTFESLAVSVLERSLLIVPLVWLAIHASSKGSEAKKLEEDYEFKAATATSFEGYRDQLVEVEGQTGKKPLSDLCDKTLATLSLEPGRLYSKHPDPNPLSNAVAALKKLYPGQKFTIETAAGKISVDDMQSTNKTNTETEEESCQ